MVDEFPTRLSTESEVSTAISNAIRQHDVETSNTAPLVASILLSGFSMATAHISYRSYKTNSAIEENQDTPTPATIDTEHVDNDVSISIAME